MKINGACIAFENRLAIYSSHKKIDQLLLFQPNNLSLIQPQPSLSHHLISSQYLFTRSISSCSSAGKVAKISYLVPIFVVSESEKRDCERERRESERVKSEINPLSLFLFCSSQKINQLRRHGQFDWTP